MTNPSPECDHRSTGLDRCIRTVVGAVMALRDCGESDSDIAKALNAVNLFGPLEVIKRMEAAEELRR